MASTLRVNSSCHGEARQARVWGKGVLGGRGGVDAGSSLVGPESAQQRSACGLGGQSQTTDCNGTGWGPPSRSQMTDKTEWLDWACLGWTGVTDWTGEWLRSFPLAQHRRVGPVEQDGQVEQLFLARRLHLLRVGATRWGDYGAPWSATAGHWLESDRPQCVAVLSESILGRSFFSLFLSARPTWDWTGAGDWGPGVRPGGGKDGGQCTS